MGAYHPEKLPMTATTGTAEKGQLSTTYYTTTFASIVHKEHSLVCRFAPETHLQQDQIKRC